LHACLPNNGFTLHYPSPPKEDKMAKGQVRSNRETRKPKKDKTAAVTAAPAGAQVKLAGSGLTLGKKPK
jgi:hypothetical protein